MLDISAIYVNINSGIKFFQANMIYRFFKEAIYNG